MTTTLWYSRCPVATASGIAYQRGMFDAEFEGSDYEVRNIKELGRSKANTHFTGALPDSFREGGFIPPLWARQNGADTTVLASLLSPKPCVFTPGPIPVSPVLPT